MENRDVGSCGKFSRLLKKKELLSYYVLCLEEGKVWNIGEAVDVLSNRLNIGRRTCFSILRRFRRLGLLEGINEVDYRCLGFLKYVDELYRNYLCRKRKR